MPSCWLGGRDWSRQRTHEERILLFSRAGPVETLLNSLGNVALFLGFCQGFHADAQVTRQCLTHSESRAYV
jgi:hypothetical protein